MKGRRILRPNAGLCELDVEQLVASMKGRRILRPNAVEGDGGRAEQRASMKGRRILRPNLRSVRLRRSRLPRFNEGPENSPAKPAEATFNRLRDAIASMKGRRILRPNGLGLRSTAPISASLQ